MHVGLKLRSTNFHCSCVDLYSLYQILLFLSPEAVATRRQITRFFISWQLCLIVRYIYISCCFIAEPCEKKHVFICETKQDCPNQWQNLWGIVLFSSDYNNHMTDVDDTVTLPCLQYCNNWGGMGNLRIVGNIRQRFHFIRLTNINWRAALFSNIKSILDTWVCFILWKNILLSTFIKMIIFDNNCAAWHADEYCHNTELAETDWAWKGGQPC